MEAPGGDGRLTRRVLVNQTHKSPDEAWKGHLRMESEFTSYLLVD